MSGIINVTFTTRQVAAAIREGDNWGIAIIKRTGLSMSVVYAMLKRMRESNWVTWEIEPIKVATEAGRPPRKTYALTSIAIDRLGWADLVAEAQQTAPSR